MMPGPHHKQLVQDMLLACHEGQGAFRYLPFTYQSVSCIKGVSVIR